MSIASENAKDIHAKIRDLRQLTDLPEAPHEAPAPYDDGTRKLSVLREKQLADELAFLSGTTDDAAKVMAVALEETVNGTSLTIRLACNTAVPPDTVKGFSNLARLLENAHHRGIKRSERLKLRLLTCP